MTPTHCEPLRAVRERILADRGLTGAPLRNALCAAYDAWLAASLPERSGAALVAVGGLARREPAAHSDLDLVLLHDGSGDAPGALAERIWYPIWDSGVRLDHAVRTPAEALAVARADLPALLGLLEVRHLAGDPALSATLGDEVRQFWRASATRLAPQLHALSRERWEIAGDGAFLLEPDLKHSRGGLRDGQILRALALAQLADHPEPTRAAYALLLDVRGEVHRRAGRAVDVLRHQERADIAAVLGIGPDRDLTAGDELLRRVNLAARLIGHTLDQAFRRVTVPQGRSLRRRPARVPLARDVVGHDGEVVLARDADPRADAGLLLRAARAAAENALPLAPFTLRRLGVQAASLPEPWPAGAREDLVALLGAGGPAVAVLESLDLSGLLAPLLPGWDAVRGRAQHNPVHRHTVDRHLFETAAAAAGHTREVARPDLLLVAALLHDIGKIGDGDHSVAGAPMAAAIAARLGYPAPDVTMIRTLVRHHLLLVETATGRDIDDPKTITTVVDAVGGSRELLDLLHALTAADAEATGPAAWTPWRAGLVADLVGRVRAVLRGAAPPPLPELGEDVRGLTRSGELAVRQRGDELVIAAPDTVGVLYRTAGVLALHLLDVRAASVRTQDGMVICTFDVTPRFGTWPPLPVLRGDLAHTLDEAGDLAERLRAKERSYGGRDGERRPPSLRWIDDAATAATVLEVRAEEAIGLLCRLAAALERCRLRVRSARIRSLGSSVVDSFYLTTRDGPDVPDEVRAAVAIEMRRV